MSRPNHYGGDFYRRLRSAAQHTPVFTKSTASLLFNQFGYLWFEHMRGFGHAAAIHGLITVDCYSSNTALLNHWDPDRDTIFRVCIDPLTQRVEVTHFGIECIDLTEVGTYANTSKLPDWMQERLAVLCMMPSKPPTTAVEGVGQRINATTYWLAKP